MVLGFTGTQRGMSRGQLVEFERLLARMQPYEFHHGDCVGADEQAHAAVRRVLPKCWIVVHPPVVTRKRAYCKGDDVRGPKSYVERNHDVVDESEHLVVVPRINQEELRSGTWATFRYAEKIGRLYTIIER